MLFEVLCWGTPEGSTGSGSGFKVSQKMGQRGNLLHTHKPILSSIIIDSIYQIFFSKIGVRGGGGVVI